LQCAVTARVTGEIVPRQQHTEHLSAASNHSTESSSSSIQVLMEKWTRSLSAKLARGSLGRLETMNVLRLFAAWFGGLFSRREDNFKALLIADLGIER
jgi:hypothetical protein